MCQKVAVAPKDFAPLTPVNHESSIKDGNLFLGQICHLHVQVVYLLRIISKGREWSWLSSSSHKSERCSVEIGCREQFI